MRRFLRYPALIAAIAIPPIVAVSCDETVPSECVDDQQLVDGVCVAIPTEAGPPPDTGTETPDTGQDTGVEASPQDPDFHFDGVTSLSPASATSMLVTWGTATDPFTAPDEMKYRVYLATAAGEEHFDVADATATGATSVVVSGLTAGLTYYAIVRATNKAGEQDQNSKELSAKALADTTPPDLQGTPSVVPRLGCRSRVTWAAATDALTAHPGITYRVYLADAPFDPATSPLLATVLGVLSADVTIPGATAPYHSFVVVAEDAAGNRSTGVKVGTAVPDTVKFTESVEPILTNNCAPSCHTVNTTNKFTPAFDEGYAYETILGVPGAPVYANFCKVGSAFCGPDNVVAGCADWVPTDAGPIQYLLIKPGDPACSVLYQVLLQDKMPPANQGVPSPSACDKTLIHDWIEHGAQK